MMAATTCASADVVAFLRATKTGYRIGAQRLPLSTCHAAAAEIEGAQLVVQAARELLTSAGLDAIGSGSPEWADLLQHWPGAARLMDALDLACADWRANGGV